MTDITTQARETPMNTITAHQSAVKAVSWCPWQNNVLATAGQTSFTGHSSPSTWRSGGTVDRTVRIWNTASMTQLQSFDTGSQVLLSSCYKSAEKLTLPCLQVSSIAWNSEYKEMITGHGFSHNQLTVWRYPRWTLWSFFPNWSSFQWEDYEII